MFAFRAAGKLGTATCTEHSPRTTLIQPIDALEHTLTTAAADGVSQGHADTMLAAHGHGTRTIAILEALGGDGRAYGAAGTSPEEGGQENKSERHSSKALRSLRGDAATVLAERVLAALTAIHATKNGGLCALAHGISKGYTPAAIAADG